MTTLIQENDEKDSVVVPLLKTSTSVYNGSGMSQSTLADSDEQHHHHHHPAYDLIVKKKEIDKSIEISLDKREFKPATISFDHINYIIGSENVKNRQSCSWQTEAYPFWKAIPSKQILTDVSGIFTPGMNAILGMFSIYSNFNSIDLLDSSIDRSDRLWKINSTRYSCRSKG